MIPADVASRLQVSADTALRPVAPAQEIADKLSGLVAGQKVMAQIQAMLPNGTYRAMINQRSITLALPFSAKSGDALELQVTESDGKLALAVLTPPDDGGNKAAPASAPATLSRTGQLISTLYSEARDAKGATSAVALNGNQPIGATPISAQDLLPQLKQAITQSGMFYEAHQAEWVEGRFSQAQLLQEPQGKLSAPATLNAAAQADAQQAKAAPASGEAAAAPPPKAALAPDQAAAVPRPVADGATASEAPAKTGAAPAAATAQAAAQTPGQLVAPQAQTMVQQQLDALATQNFSWQGQIWPGQEMRWDIDEQAARDSQDGGQDSGQDDGAARWATRLRLTLPKLGEIDAQIRLQGNQITLAMSAGDEQTRALMRSAGVALRSQLDQAGISLASMGVAALAADKGDGQSPQ